VDARLDQAGTQDLQPLLERREIAQVQLDFEFLRSWETSH
jgi:hypothetical protein